MRITCADGHQVRTIEPEVHVHEDGTERNQWRCPDCRTTLTMRATSRDVLFARVSKAGLSTVPIQTLIGAIEAGHHH